MAVTQAEVLNLFSQIAAIKNSDQFLVIKANQDGTVQAAKITAELVRAYLNKGFEITIGADGYLYIGGERTDSQVAGLTPQLQRGADGIYCSIDNGESWEVVAYFTDFNQQNIVLQTQQTASIRPNVLNVWGNVTSLTVTFTGGGENLLNEYMLEFTVSGNNFTLTLPNGVRWSEEPEWEDGSTYQVSIVNNLAIYAGWEAASV